MHFETLAANRTILLYNVKVSKVIQVGINQKHNYPVFAQSINQTKSEKKT